MKASLVRHLVCPRCRRPLKLKAGGAESTEIMEGTLSCAARHGFRVSGGIPRLVTDRNAKFARTESSFSAKWRNYHETYHSKEWFVYQRRWFLRRYGWGTVASLDRFLKSRSRILDAGTGVGNSAKWLSSNRGADVFAIDASESVEYAHERYGSLPNVHFLQADVAAPPFKKGFFDFVCADQMLHHTRDTAESFESLASLLSKGGEFAVYVYSVKAPLRELADDHIRGTTTRMTVKQCAEFSRDMALLGRDLSRLKARITIRRDIPALRIRKGTYDLQRLVYWHFLKCWWSEDVPFEQCVATNFDWYFPEHARRHTPEEVRGWFGAARLGITHFDESPSGISAIGRKAPPRARGA